MKKLDANKVAKWFKQKLWTKEMVLDAVSKGNLTEEQAKEIVGE